MSDINVKIFSTHTVGKESYILKNEIFQPIRNNANLDKAHNMPGDNTGDNISSKGSSYCELCTQYWAWKNVQADYYGFCHYRRFFSFADELKPTDDWSVILRDYLNDESVKEFKLDDVNHIRHEVEKYDVIAIAPVDLKRVNIQSVYEQYKTGQKLHIEDIDLMMSIIENKYPAYYSAAKRYMEGQTLYLCNMFIMRQDLFKQYSEWLFNILAEFDKQNDMANYSVEGYRTPGHLGERLFGIFFTYLKEQNKYKLGERQLVMFAHPELQVSPSPTFSENNIPIIMSSSDFYAKFASATIRSIADYAGLENNYDIIVLVKDMGEITRNRLRQVVKGLNNFSLRFFDVGNIFSKYCLYESSTISVETYFRIIIPEYFKEYDKVVYLDSDIIVKTDIAEIFNIDIGDNLLGGVVDVVNAGVVNGFDKEGETYNREKLQLKDIYSQINAGVILINCIEFRKKFTTKFLLNFVQAGNFRFQDQDALNVLCEGRIQYLDPAWNFFADPVDGYRGWIATYAPKELYMAYRDAAKNPKILHYAGNEKPWWFPDVEWSDDFWEVFMRTPFYNAFIRQRMTDVAFDIANNSGSSKSGEVIKRSLFIKGIMCLKENGWRYTFRKLLSKLKL